MGIIEEVQSKKDTAFYISFRITLETNCTDAKVCRDRLADAIRQHALWTMMFIDEMEPGEVEVCFCLNENQTEARQTTWVKYRECTRDVKNRVHKFQV